MLQKAQTLKEYTDTWDFVKIKKFCSPQILQSGSGDELRTGQPRKLKPRKTHARNR